jgi:hypothetical protein
MTIKQRSPTDCKPMTLTRSQSHAAIDAAISELGCARSGRAERLDSRAGRHGLIYEFVAAKIDQRRFPPPGQLARWATGCMSAAAGRVVGGDT